MLQKAMETNYINMNCVDPLGRTALLMAIDNENPEMVELLIKHRVETKDALLHAISEEFVEAVEALLEHEESIAKPGQPAVSSFITYFLCVCVCVFFLIWILINSFVLINLQQQFKISGFSAYKEYSYKENKPTKNVHITCITFEPFTIMDWRANNVSLWTF